MGMRFPAGAAATTWEEGNANPHDQWPNPQCRGGAQYAPPLGVAGERRPHRHEIRLRHRAMRRLHGPPRRRRRALLLDAGERGSRQADHHDRGARRQRHPLEGAESLARPRCAAVRLLPVRHDHGGDGAPAGEAEADRRRDQQRDHQHLPLRNLSADPGGDPRCGDRVREAAMTHMPRMNRRAFVVGAAAVGGGFAFGFEIPFGPQVVRAADGSPEVNALVVIRPDDTVIVRIARSEMGQGTETGLAQLVAEELQCDWSKVKTEFPSAGANLARKRVWGDMSTGGSRGIRTSHEYVRKGGAAAREMLIQAAANEWKVPASECSAANSIITHRPSGRTLSYGKVAEAAARLEPPKEITLKDVKEWTIAGKPLKRLDTLDKLTGRMTYGIDLKMPNMLVATIKDAPVRGAKVKSFDAAKAQSMPGVKKVVAVGDSAVAVIADTFWHAKTAVDALPITYEDTPNSKVSTATFAEVLKEGLTAEQGFVGHKAGDAKVAIAGAARKFEATYAYPN